MKETVKELRRSPQTGADGRHRAWARLGRRAARRGCGVGMRTGPDSIRLCRDGRGRGEEAVGSKAFFLFGLGIRVVTEGVADTDSFYTHASVSARQSCC